MDITKDEKAVGRNLLDRTQNLLKVLVRRKLTEGHMALARRNGPYTGKRPSILIVPGSEVFYYHQPDGTYVRIKIWEEPGEFWRTYRLRTDQRTFTAKGLLQTKYIVGTSHYAVVYDPPGRLIGDKTSSPDSLLNR